MIQKAIWSTLKRFNLSIRRDHPRDFIVFCKGYFNNKNLTCAEIGVQYGMNALYMLRELNIKKIYLVDPYELFDDSFDSKVINNYTTEKIKNARQEALDRLELFGKQIEWVYEYSDNAVTKLPDKLDFVYIDANHSYEFIKKDIQNYWNKIMPGGLLAGHDLSIYSVAKAVVEFANENNLEVISKFKDAEWIIKKPRSENE